MDNRKETQIHGMGTWNEYSIGEAETVIVSPAERTDLMLKVSSVSVDECRLSSVQAIPSFLLLLSVPRTSTTFLVPDLPLAMCP